MLFDNRISMRKYVLRAAVISFLPSMAIVFILAASLQFSPNRLACRLH